MASNSPMSPPTETGAIAIKDSPPREPQLCPSSSKDKPSSFSSSAAGMKRAPLPCKPKYTALIAQPTAPPQPPLTRISLPAVVDKMSMTAVISPNPTPEQLQPKMSMTSKEWVIPPRPKPGRKPATDTPPTKRKAQNRAAQRAFRERRAARVGELEELLEEQKMGHEAREKELNQRIHDLELDVQSFRSRCLLLESMLERERQERIRVETQAETLSRRHGQGGFRTETMSSLLNQPFDGPQTQQPVQQRHSLSDGRIPQQPITTKHFSISHIITPPETLAAQSPDDVSDAALTCGNCSPDGRCACAEEALASVVGGCGKCGFGTVCRCLDDVAKPQDLKRPISPSGASSGEKRHRSFAAANMESDFSAMFSKKSTALLEQSLQQASIIPQLPPTDSLAFRDGCGFCKDGTYCVCADTAMTTPAMSPIETPPPPVARQTRTPPPSDSDVGPSPMAMEMTADGAVKLPRRKQPRSQPQAKPAGAASRGCGANGPGTCAQCQADPKSGLFCRLMAANLDREQGGSSGGGCCGGKGASGGCCKAGPKQEKITLPSLPSLGLSCAEAYQTLSSHRNFEQAADDIGSWLPKLKATPKGNPQTAQPGRMPIEVEAASIMSVLKEFDIRFGRDC